MTKLTKRERAAIDETVRVLTAKHRAETAALRKEIRRLEQQARELAVRVVELETTGR